MPKKSVNKWPIQTVDFVSVKPFEDNPRTIKSKRMSALRTSLQRFGYVDLIVWNRRTGNIVGGHQRFKILVEKGIRQAKMLVVDMCEAMEVAANITLNNPNIEGEWTDPVNELLDHLETKDPELFVDADFDDLRQAVENITPGGDEDADTECPCCQHQWKIADGDVVILTRAQQEALKNGEDLEDLCGDTEEL